MSYLRIPYSLSTLSGYYLALLQMPNDIVRFPFKKSEFNYGPNNRSVTEVIESHNICGKGEFFLTEEVYIEARYKHAPRDIDVLDGPVIVSCEHGDLIAELYVSDTNKSLHRLDGPAEIIFDPRSGSKSEKWHINGRFLPDFGEAVSAGIEGLAEYIRSYPELKDLVMIYLKEKVPYSSLLASMEAADLIG